MAGRQVRAGAGASTWTGASGSAERASRPLAWLATMSGAAAQDDRAALASARLEPAGGAMRWTWPAPSELTDPLRPIVHGAVELLTNGPLDRVRTCANCRWLFLDQSRNRSRRWCSMGECGTQLKHRRFVERRRREGASR